MQSKAIIDSWSKIEPDSIAGARMRSAILSRNRSMNCPEKSNMLMRPVLRAAVKVGVLAAVLCLVAIAGSFLAQRGNDAHPLSGNSFALKAYALEALADGSYELLEVDIIDRRISRMAIFDIAGQALYYSAGLKCEGENISKVEFSVETGFFAGLHAGDIKSRIEESAREVNPFLSIGLILTNDKSEFDPYGKKIRLDFGAGTDEMFIFWGLEYDNPEDIPDEIAIRAEATFNDGSVTEQTLTLALYGSGLARMYPRNTEDTFAYYGSIPLDECELVPDSVRAVTVNYYYVSAQGMRGRAPDSDDADMYYYWYKTDRTSVYAHGISFYEDEAAFDEDGIWRFNWGDHAGDNDERGFVAVIRRNDDGTMTGMVYRTPKRVN